MTRVSLFIDGENMFHAQKRMQYFIDFIKLRDHFSKGKELTNSFYYKGISKKPHEEKERKFLNYLAFNNFTVRQKDVKTIYDVDTGQPSTKCNLDIEIVIDMLTYADDYDEAILFSGDGDFERAVDLLRTSGKKIFVASCKGMIAQELANSANLVIFLEDCKRNISRTQRQPQKEEIKKTEEKKEIKEKSK